MSGDTKHIIYTAKDIEAYFSGKLSPSRMHAIEKDALDDPFLAEAMEGYEAMQGRSWQPQLIELHRHFEEEKKPARVIYLSSTTSRWWKVAAAILVIACGATLTYMLTNKKTNNPGNEPIAKTETPAIVIPASPQKEAPTVKADIMPPSTQNKIAPVYSSTDENRGKQPGDIVTVTSPQKFTQPTPANGDFVYTPSKQLPSDNKDKTPGSTATTEEKLKSQALETVTNTAVPPLNNNIFNSNNGANNNIAKNEATQEVKDDGLAKKAEQKPAQVYKGEPSNHSFIAQVVGPDNTPLPFANINIKNENFGTYADVKGNFRLVSTDSLVNVEVRSVGYLPRSYTLHSSLGQNRIVLAEDENTAKERAVVKDNGLAANRSIRRASVLKDSLYVNVEPADGWANYNAYIANNMDIPQNALKKDLHGEVELSFKVHPNGAITDITVSKSDCADCAELAKRLVEQGPQWKIKKGIKKSSGRIKVQF